MTKTRSKVKLCIVACLTVIGLLLTFMSFVIPTTSTTFEGFFNAIDYGYDIVGGRLSIYDVNNPENPDGTKFTEDEVSERIDETIKRYNDVFGKEGFIVTRQNNSIRMEVSDKDNKNIQTLLASAGSMGDLFDLIASDKGITINTSSNDYNAAGSITSEYVVGAKLGTSQVGEGGVDIYPITIELNEEGKDLLREMTKKSTPSTDSSTNQEGEKKLYIYLDGNNYYKDGYKIESSISSITLYATHPKAAEALKLQISALAKPITFTKVMDETITSSLNTSNGAFFGNVKTMLLVALSIVLVATITFLCIRYRMLGLFATMAILIFTTLYSFLLQSIPLVSMDINGLLGVLLVYGLLFVGIVEIFEKIRSEYALGKKIPNSVRSGFKKNVLRTLDKYGFMLIFSSILYLVGSAALKAFSVSFFVGLFVNYFTLFVALRGMCLSYTVVNSTRKNFYNLKREAVKNEI